MRIATILAMLVAGTASVTPARTVAPIEYPANPDSPRIPPAVALADVFPDQPTATIALERFGEVGEIASGHVMVYTVSTDRMVYEIRLPFTTPYTDRNITWSSGARDIIMDAETGDILLSGVRGTVSSVHRWWPTPPPRSQ